MGNDSLVRELVYTARRLESREAERLGLVSGVYQDREKLLEAALDLARLIASRSPVAVQGSKVNLNYSRDHSVDEALEFMVSRCMSGSLIIREVSLFQRLTCTQS